jgi:hypothetical protein
MRRLSMEFCSYRFNHQYRFAWLAVIVLKRDPVFYPLKEIPCSIDVWEETLNTTVRFLTSMNISCCTCLDFQLAEFCYRKWQDNPGTCSFFRAYSPVSCSHFSSLLLNMKYNLKNSSSCISFLIATQQSYAQVKIDIDYQKVRHYVNSVNSIDPKNKILPNLRILLLH